MNTDISLFGKEPVAPVFARTRWHYDSYTDFWRLVELAGFETCYVDEIDLALPKFFIVTPVNGEFRPHIVNMRSSLSCPQKAKVVFWCLERPDGDNAGPVATVIDDLMQYVDQVWVSDLHYWSLDKRTRYVTLGSDPRLRERARAKPEYALCHLSYLVHRRSLVINRLAQNLPISPNGWGEERARILSSSRAMLNIHQTPAPIGEPLRFALAAAYALPLLSEHTENPWPLENENTLLMCQYERLDDAVPEWLGRLDLPEFGERLHRRLCFDFTFRDCVLRGVEEALRPPPEV